MGPLLIALVPFLQLAFNGSAALTIIFDGLTLSQWASLAAALVTLASSELPEEKKLAEDIINLHPNFSKLFAMAKASGPAVAAEAVIADMENAVKSL